MITINRIASDTLTISIINTITGGYDKWVSVFLDFPSLGITYESGNMFDFRSSINISFIFFSIVLYLPFINYDLKNKVLKNKFGFCLFKRQLITYKLNGISYRFNIPFISNIYKGSQFLGLNNSWYDVSERSETSKYVYKKFNDTFKHNNIDIYSSAYLIRHKNNIMLLPFKFLRSYKYTLIIEYHNFNDDSIYNRYSLITSLNIDDLYIDDNVDLNTYITDVVISNRNFLEIYEKAIQ